MLTAYQFITVATNLRLKAQLNLRNERLLQFGAFTKKPPAVPLSLLNSFIFSYKKKVLKILRLKKVSPMVARSKRLYCWLNQEAHINLSTYKTFTTSILISGLVLPVRVRLS